MPLAHPSRPIEPDAAPADDLVMKPLRPDLDASVLREGGETAWLRILNAIEEYVYTGEFLPDGAYRVVFAGPCRERFLGLSPAEGRTAIWADYVHPEDMASFETAHDNALETSWIDTEYRIVGADGVVRWVRDRGRIRVEDGRRLLDGSILDVSAVHEAQDALEAARAHAHRLSRTDPLTGVANRRALPERLAELCREGAGLLLVDVDHFKQVNDFHGHRAGDAVLVELARRLRRRVRADDDVVRMGGEEFLVLLPGLAHESLLLERAEALRDAADRPVSFEGETISLTVSVGAALAAEGSDPDTLLAAADDGLYAAKRLGRNRVALGRPDRAGREAGMEESAALRIAQGFAAALVPVGVPRARTDAVAGLAAATAGRLGLAHGVLVRSRLAGLVHELGRLRTEPGAPAREIAARGAELVAAVPELVVLGPVVGHLADRFDGAGGRPGGRAIPIESRIIAAAAAWVREGSPDALAVQADEGALDPEVVRALLLEVSAGEAEALAPA